MVVNAFLPNQLVFVFRLTLLLRCMYAGHFRFALRIQVGGGRAEEKGARMLAWRRGGGAARRLRRKHLCRTRMPLHRARKGDAHLPPLARSTRRAYYVSLFVVAQTTCVFAITFVTVARGRGTGGFGFGLLQRCAALCSCCGGDIGTRCRVWPRHYFVDQFWFASSGDRRDGRTFA